jgi:hypothetical protein
MLYYEGMKDSYDTSISYIEKALTICNLFSIEDMAKDMEMIIRAKFDDEMNVASAVLSENARRFAIANHTRLICLCMGQLQQEHTIRIRLYAKPF